jgi:hypothetical protein
MWALSAGLRIGFVPSSGYDTFSRDDVLPQWTFAASRTIWSRGRVSLAAGLAWDVGGTSTTTRGLDAGIFANRFSVPIEARVHPRTWAYGFVKLAPGANYISARVNDPSAPSTLIANQWSFAGDGSIGASITPLTTPGSVRVWLTPEIGYSFSTTNRLVMSPKDKDSIVGTASKTDLGDLALSGLFFRVGGSLTF